MEFVYLKYFLFYFFLEKHDARDKEMARPDWIVIVTIAISIVIIIMLVLVILIYM